MRENMTQKALYSSDLFVFFAILLIFLGSIYSWFIPSSISQSHILQKDYIFVGVIKTEFEDEYSTSYHYTPLRYRTFRPIPTALFLRCLQYKH